MMRWIRNPALLAIAASICLAGPSSGYGMENKVHFLLETACGIGLMTLAYIELRIRHGRS